MFIQEYFVGAAPIGLFEKYIKACPTLLGGLGSVGYTLFYFLLSLPVVIGICVFQLRVLVLPALGLVAETDVDGVMVGADVRKPLKALEAKVRRVKNVVEGPAQQLMVGVESRQQAPANARVK